jgi:hypothetical protein
VQVTSVKFSSLSDAICNNAVHHATNPANSRDYHKQWHSQLHFITTAGQFKSDVNLPSWVYDGATLTNNNDTQGISQNEDNMFLTNYDLPIVWDEIFLIGIVGNGILFFIFILHPCMRAKSNVCLINLVISDILTLIVNLPLIYVDFLSNT